MKLWFDMTEDEKEQRRVALWKAASSAADPLYKGGGSRSTGYFHPQGHSCICIAKKHESDGTKTVYILEATYDYNDDIRVTVESSTNNCEDFWDSVLKETDSRDRKRAVIDNECYTIKPDSPRPGPGDGFGGRKFDIEWLDDKGEPTGDTTTTRNMWFRGVIPPVYRDRLKPNARLIEREKSCPENL